ncbi:MAG: peptidoglycan DD-metalloendopeptidase family protein [Bacteroidales bacterium]|nr:peptidoglycan DD-metalloendopeptidase family protein [Bacteroidales bacterium]
MKKASILTLVLAFLPLMAGAQEPRISIKEAEKLIPREVRKPVKSMIPGDKPEVHDTIDTSDPVIKIVLLNNGTWHYFRDLRSLADSSVFRKNWKENELNPFKTPLQDLPFRITLCLADSSSRFCCPHQAKVFSPFGWRRRRNHMGVDLPLPMRTPVYAAFDGKVRCSMYNRGYGNVVIIRHVSGLETTYAHLAERKVSAGDYVSAGDVIGLGGSTGRSTGPHLHFETRYDGYAFDPQWLIDFESGVLRHGYFVLKRKYLSPSSKYYPESEEEEEEIYKTEEEERAEAERIAKEMAAARYHTVKAGDNLSRLAVKYNTSVSAICKLNGITPSTTLRIGRKLRVK